MVLDYLVYHGYVQSAERFSKEANLPTNFKDMTLPQRMEIRSSILSGNVSEAIEKINDNFPAVSRPISPSPAIMIRHCFMHHA
jgi:LisH protein